jgi:hypothetical protein
MCFMYFIAWMQIFFTVFPIIFIDISRQLKDLQAGHHVRGSETV